jgi:ketosteroid isomerase-like protein
MRWPVVDLRRLAGPCRVRDTRRVMSEESTTPDLVELTRRVYESLNRRDLDAVMRDYDRDSVLDLSPAGLGSYEGQAAIRGFNEDWIGAWEEFEFEPEQILDLGNGVVFAMVRQTARPVGSTGYVQMHHANVIVWVDGVVARVTHYNDIDQARVAAERLAESRE